ncbi:MAG: hypothetical protein K2X90_02215 [Candidatus Babeliaceae bacterium]|nr:hypothetical protein [Candidatus Babeliaceae bacterium]
MNEFKKIYLTFVCILTGVSLQASSQTSIRDALVEMARHYDDCERLDQDCTCRNTKKHGRCILGDHYGDTSLYCKCD